MRSMHARKRAGIGSLILSIAFGLAAGTSLVAGATGLEPSNVVLVFDVSNSILLSTDGTNREFADALDGVADRAQVVASDLAAGNADVSFVVFGRTAVPYATSCTRIHLHGDAAAIARFEGCLRSIAGEYRAGSRAPVRQRINTQDTDHVAALVEAASLLPNTSTRSAVIFFTDGKNDPPGTAHDHEDVVALATPAFAGKSPLAVLPVGLGAGAGAFETELSAIYTGFLRDMQPCEGRASFAWPSVVFPSAVTAGTAVALALQEVTCSFTVAPTAAPSVAPSPSPAPTEPPATLPPPTPTAVPAEPSQPSAVPCSGGFLDCNPWAVVVLGGLVLAALVGAGFVGFQRYQRRSRVWITAQVDGGPNLPLGWGPELGIHLAEGEAGWSATALPPAGAAVRVRFERENRFMVTTGTRIVHVHQGDPTPIRDDRGGIHQVILRRYRDRPNDRAGARTAPDSAEPPA